MDLRNAGNGVDRQDLTEAYIGICLFFCLSPGGFLNGFAFFHKAGRQGPEPLTRINCAPAKQDFVTFCRNRSCNYSRIYVVYELAM